MERYENIVKIEEIRKLTEEGQYRKAVKILDTMDLHRIKSLTDLSILADVLTENERYEEAMDLLNKIYEKSKTRRVIYQMVELSIKKGDAEQAENYLQKYMRAAPNDAYRFIFRYYIDKLKGEPYDALIDSLEQLKEYEYIEIWAYELAKLYHKSGLKDKCIRECSDIILWFGDGIYVEKAKLLKAYYVGEIDPIHILKAKEKNQTRERLGLDKTKDYKNIREQINEYLAVEETGIKPQQVVPGQGKQEESKEREFPKTVSKEADSFGAGISKVDIPGTGSFGAGISKVDIPGTGSFGAGFSKVDISGTGSFGTGISKVNISETGSFGAGSSKESIPESVSYEEEPSKEDISETGSCGTEPSEGDISELSSLRVDASEGDVSEPGSLRTGLFEADHSEPSSLKTDSSKEDFSEADSSEPDLSQKEFSERKENGQSGNEETDAGKAELPEEESIFSLFDRVGYDYAREMGGFLINKELKEQLRYCLESILSDSAGNKFLVITGERENGKTSLGLKICKGLYSLNWIKTERIAKITGENLNRVNITAQKHKLAGSSLIIERPGLINEKAAGELLAFLKENSTDIFVIMEGTREEVAAFLTDYPELAQHFPYEIPLVPYTLKQLIGFGVGFLESKEYKFMEDAKEEFIKRMETITASGKAEGAYGKTMRFAAGVRKAAEERYKVLLGDILSSRNLTNEDLLYIMKEDIRTEVI